MYIARKAGLYEKLRPLSGTHQVWGGLVPDFTLDETKELIGSQHAAEHIDIGVSGYKIDECDGYDEWLWPDHAEFPSGLNGVEMRQIFAPMAARMVEDRFRKAGRRTAGLIRAANAGMQNIPLFIYNDCYDFKQYMVGLASSGFTGALWCPEIRDAASGEEWVRRFQMAVLSPMLQLNGWWNSAKPWQFPEVFPLVKAAVELRRSLEPYIYTAFARYRFHGTPPFRALCMDYAELQGETEAGQLDGTANPYQLDTLSEITDQYMAGESLMVCPAFSGQTSRKVVLPPGLWFDYYTGEAFEGEQVITINCPLEKLPIFVRADKSSGNSTQRPGAIIPTREDGCLKARCYGQSGTGMLYDDDGESFDYEKGAYYLAKLSFTRLDGQVCGTVETLHVAYGKPPQVRWM
jgi:alpha-D-xyloside xylohydrolase